VLLHRPRHSLARVKESQNDLCVVKLPLKGISSMALGFMHLPLWGDQKEEEDENEELDQSVVLYVDARDFRGEMSSPMQETYAKGSMVLVLLGAAVSIYVAANAPARAPNALARAFLQICLLGLGLFGLRFRNTHILTIFISVTSAEALISATGLSNLLEFANFLLKLAVCYHTSSVKESMLATWFSPLH